MRVLLDAHQIGRKQTGNETYVSELTRALGARPDVDLVLAMEPAARPPRTERPLTVHRVPRRGPQRVMSLGKLAQVTGVDVLHTIYFLPPRPRRPTVVTVHDVSYERFPEFFSRREVLRNRILVRDAVRRASAVITVSETSRRDLIERYGVPASRVVAIYNGVASRFLDCFERDPEPIGDRPVRVLALGTLQPRKNLDRLMTAVRRASFVRPIDLRVVGPDGYQAGVIRARLSGSAGVEVVGYVSDDSLVDEYRRADMLVYPSIYEGFGLPVVEAMACSTPVITSTGGSLPEIAGGAAVIVDPLDEVAIAEAILRLADDVRLRRDLVAKGRARARRFSWADSAAHHLDVYRRAVGE
jgi:glycosyltransferase involved in cell wall biosynthesis